MKLTLPKLSSVGNVAVKTLSAVATTTHSTTLQTAIAKPSLTSIAKAAVMVTPLGFIATEVIDHRADIKSTLAPLAKEIKKDAIVVGNEAKKGATTIEKGVVSGVKSVASGMENMMYIAMGVGGLVVLMMVLK